MPRQARRRSLALISIAFAFVGLAIGATSWMAWQQSRANSSVVHTLTVQHELTRLLSALQDAETGQRGFLLTRDPLFLRPYDMGRRSIPPRINALATRISDNPDQTARLAELRAITAERLSLLEQRVAEAQRGDQVSVAELRAGRALMTRARELIAEMQAEEQSLLAQRIGMARNILWLVIAGLTITAVFLFGLGVVVLRRMNDQIAALNSARDNLQSANADLIEQVSRREQAEAQTRQLQKMEAVGQLTGGIAHDFNNMLAIVVGSLDLAKRRLGKGEADKAVGCIDNAMEGASRASQLTARLMAFSRQQPLEPQVTDANKLVGGMSELLRRTLGEQVMVETVLAGGLWKTIIDPGQLENALVNLCVNGRDAMPDGGRLTVETANAELDDRYAAAHDEVAAGQYVMISVTDEGTGMTADVVERVFEPFYTTKGVGKGTGLGLSQVFGFIKQSRGHVKIYSEVGEGTTVKLYLPRASAADEALQTGGAAAAAVLAELPHARGEEIVLVVEDDERVRHISIDALRELGYTVVQASDAKQALAVLEVQPKVDLVFTDVVMPEMTGRQLVEAIHARWPDMPVLYTTGYTRNSIVHNGTLDRGVALLSKPFTVEQLAQKVRQVLDGAG